MVGRPFIHHPDAYRHPSLVGLEFTHRVEHGMATPDADPCCDRRAGLELTVIPLTVGS
jgi:hypothetical protein